MRTAKSGDTLLALTSRTQKKHWIIRAQKKGLGCVIVSRLLGFGVGILLLAGWVAGYAQEEATSEMLTEEDVYQIVVQQIQEVRTQNNMDTLLVADFANQIARAFAEHHMETRQTVRDPSLIARIMGEYGGNPQAHYIVLTGRARVKKGKRILDRETVAQTLAAKFTQKKRNVKKMLDEDFVFLGVGVRLSDKGSGVIYVLLGSAQLDNRGADKKLRKQLVVRYTKGRRGLITEYEVGRGQEDPCADVDKFTDWIGLAKSLSISGKYVYMHYPDLMALTPLLDKKKDGFAIEIVLEDQFACGQPNILDWRRPFRGKVLKPRYARYIQAKNESVTGELQVPVGKLPGRFRKYGTGLNYEFNILVIQNKHFCRRIIPGYRDTVQFEVEPNFQFYPDTFYRQGDKRFQVIKEKHTIEFRIYFEKGKYNYRYEDIKPILDTLAIPLFTIDSIYIRAHSSLEGDSAVNAELQIKRGTSIAEALFSRFPHLQKVVRIEHDDSWELFKQDIKKDPQWGWLADTTKAFVRNLLNRNPQLVQHLEPMLQKHRFASVKIYATIDIKGGAELLFFQRRMDIAVRKKDVKEALAIQRYLIQRVLEGRYPPEVVLNLKVPSDPAFAQLHLNAWWMRYWALDKRTITPQRCQELQGLEQHLADNQVFQYNRLVCQILYEDLPDDQIEPIQEEIQKLQASPLRAKDITRLDLYFNIRALDQLLQTHAPDDVAVQSRIERLKQIFQPEEWEWQWGGKIAYLAYQTRNEDWAIDLLENYLQRNVQADVNFYRFYAFLVSWNEEKVLSSYYRRALLKWYAKDPVGVCDRLGKTFQGPSFQSVLDPYIKELRCQKCK